MKRPTGKKNGVSDGTIKRVVEECSDIRKKIEQKKEENTADILAYMESQRQTVCKIIKTDLRVLPEKIENAKTATAIITA